LPGSSAGRLQEAILELLRAALLYMGSATMDRLLRAEKATGDHCYTLTVTDRRPWWTAIVPVPSRAQVYVFAALTTVLSHLPFPVLVLHAEGNLFTDAPYYKTIRYDVSSLDQDTVPVDSLVARRLALLDRYLQVPGLSQAFRDVAARVVQGLTVRDKAQATRDYLLANYEYSLNPTATSVEDFVVNRHTGYCEHFATSMVLLLRAQGVRARPVSGFVFRYFFS
jgi:transglutaminase-like putative cysteine protease